MLVFVVEFQPGEAWVRVRVLGGVVNVEKEYHQSQCHWLGRIGSCPSEQKQQTVAEMVQLPNSGYSLPAGRLHKRKLELFLVLVPVPEILHHWHGRILRQCLSPTEAH